MLIGFRAWLLGVLSAGMYWLYTRTLRYRRVDVPPIVFSNEPKVYAHWHGDELLLLGAHIGQGLATLSSHSRDGSIMAWLLRSLGFRVVRGSSSRGAVSGLKGLIELVQKENCSVSFAVDGPRGPRFKVKPGALKLAQTAGFWLVPGAASSTRSWVFTKAWNRAFLPKPFSRCVIVYGEPVRIDRGISDSEFEALRAQIEKQMLAAKEKAESIIKGDAWIKSKRLSTQKNFAH